MSFKAMIVGGALILAAGSVVAFAGEDHVKPNQTENADDDVTDAKVKVKSDKRHKLSETDFKKIKVKTFDEAAFRDDDDEVDGTVEDDDDGDDSDGKDETSGADDSGTGSHESDDDSGDHGGGDDSGDSGDS